MEIPLLLENNSGSVPAPFSINSPSPNQVTIHINGLKNNTPVNSTSSKCCSTGISYTVLNYATGTISIITGLCILAFVNNPSSATTTCSSMIVVVGSGMLLTGMVRSWCCCRMQCCP